MSVLRVLLSPSSHSPPDIFVLNISPRPVQNSSAYICSDLLVLEVYFQPVLSAVHQRLIGFSPEVQLHALPAPRRMNAEGASKPLYMLRLALLQLQLWRCADSASAWASLTWP